MLEALDAGYLPRSSPPPPGGSRWAFPSADDCVRSTPALFCSQRDDQKVRTAGIDGVDLRAVAEIFDRSESGRVETDTLQATRCRVDHGASALCDTLWPTIKVHLERPAIARAKMIKQVGTCHPVTDWNSHEACRPDDGHAVSEAQVASQHRIAKRRVAQRRHDEIHIGCGHQAGNPLSGTTMQLLARLSQGDGVENKAEEAVDAAPQVQAAGTCRRIDDERVFARRIRFTGAFFALPGSVLDGHGSFASKGIAFLRDHDSVAGATRRGGGSFRPHVNMRAPRKQRKEPPK